MGAHRKEATVLAALEDPELSGLSTRELARRIRVCYNTVSRWRGRALEDEQRLCRDGALKHVANIGRRDLPALSGE